MKVNRNEDVDSARVRLLAERARRIYASLKANAPDEPSSLASGISKSATRSDAVLNLQLSPSQKAVRSRKAWEAKNKAFIDQCKLGTFTKS